MTIVRDLFFVLSYDIYVMSLTLFLAWRRFYKLSTGPVNERPLHRHLTPLGRLLNQCLYRELKYLYLYTEYSQVGDSSETYTRLASIPPLNLSLI